MVGQIIWFQTACYLRSVDKVLLYFCVTEEKILNIMDPLEINTAFKQPLYLPNQVNMFVQSLSLKEFLMSSILN